MSISNSLNIRHLSPSYHFGTLMSMVDIQVHKLPLVDYMTFFLGMTYGDLAGVVPGFESCTGS